MKEYRLLAVFVAAAIVFFAFGCKSAVKSAKTGKVIAEVGNEKVTLEEFNAKVDRLPEQYRALALANKDTFLDGIINQKLIYAEAVKQNLDKDPKVKEDIDEAIKEVMVKEYLRKYIEQKVVVSDANAKAYYESNKDKFQDPEKVKVSHILVDTEEQAKDLLAKLKGGADFAALAKERSKCPSKDQGGDIGLIARGQTAPEFEEAAFKLEPGQLSEVVKTQFGYHIIKVAEKQPSRILSFEEVKDQLKQMLLAEKQKEYFERLLKDLRDKYKVVVHKEVLQPAEPKQQQGAAKKEEPAPQRGTAAPSRETK